MKDEIPVESGRFQNGPRGIWEVRLCARVALFFLVSVFTVLVSTGCGLFRLPGDPSPGPTTVVNQTVIQTQSPGPTPSPSPGAQNCGGVTSIILGTQQDDFELQAGGTDKVTLVPSYYQNLLELPALCTDTLAVVFTATGNAGCTISGKEVRAASPGSCSITAKLPAIPASNAVDLTVTP